MKKAVIKTAFHFCFVRLNRSSTAAKKPSVRADAGAAPDNRPASSGNLLLLQHFADRAQHEVGMRGEEACTMCWFSSGRMLQVAYTRRPAFLQQWLAEARMAACFTVSSAMLPGDWREISDRGCGAVCPCRCTAHPPARRRSCLPSVSP